MKRFMLTAALLLVAAGCQNKTEPTTSTPPQTPQTVTQASASAKPINTHCAVDRDDEVDPKVTYLYQGKVIGFCCDKCIADFKKDPDKYMKDLK